MSPERWTRIRTIFDRVLSSDTAARPALIDQACGPDSDLRAAVQELLANHSNECGQDHAVVPPLMFHPGDVVSDRFEIVRFIAVGGMGEVYEVLDRRLELQLALKTIRDDVYDDENALARFQREIRLAREITHPNICKVFEYIEHRSGDRIVPCIIMELVRGTSLAEYLREQRPIALELALSIARDIAGALDCLHSHGIIHRDLKPSNIMLAGQRDQPERAVLMDFGLAKQIDNSVAVFSSTHIVQAGAPYFMAPELFRGDRPSTSSDIYAFGLVLDEMVTPARAFTAQSYQLLCYSKMWEQPIRPRRRMPSLPWSWNRAIGCCIDSDPNRRPRKAGEAIAQLTPRGSWRFSRRSAVILATAACAGAVPLLISLQSLAAPGPATLDVFDIENQTGQTSYDYLCGGITYELMRMLSHLEAIQVVPMHSTHSRAPQRNSAGFALHGLLQANDGRVRMYCVLEDKVGRLLWSQTFDHAALANPLETQSEVAAGAAVALRKAIQAATTDQVSQLTRMLRAVYSPRATAPALPTTSNVALDAYMLGQHFLSRGAPDTIQSGIKEFTRAANEDPRFALAYAALASAFISLTHYSYGRKSELYESARQFAEAAVSLDPSSAECHESMAAVRQCLWDWPGAEQSYRRALELKPRLASARRKYAALLIQLGRSDEGVAHLHEALEHDPYNPAAPAGLGLYLFLARRYDEAQAVLEPAAQRPNMAAAMHNLGDVYAIRAVGVTGTAHDRLLQKALQQAAGVAEIEKRLHLVESDWSDQMFANYHSLRGQNNAARPFLDRLMRKMEAGRTSPSNVALVLVGQGRSEEALDLLERSSAMRDQYVPLVRAMPFFDRLHDHPRFKRLIAAMKI